MRERERESERVNHSEAQTEKKKDQLFSPCTLVVESPPVVRVILLYAKLRFIAFFIPFFCSFNNVSRRIECFEGNSMFTLVLVNFFFLLFKEIPFVFINVPADMPITFAQ